MLRVQQRITSVFSRHQQQSSDLVMNLRSMLYDVYALTPLKEIITNLNSSQKRNDALIRLNEFCNAKRAPGKQQILDYYHINVIDIQ